MKIHKALNPRGNLAKEIEIGVRRGIWLMRLCELWLLFNGSNHRVASTSTPYAPPPNIWDAELSKMLGKAIEGSELWVRQGEVPKSRFRLLKSGPRVYGRPPPTRRWGKLLPWSLVYQSWRDGSLGRGIMDSMAVLPKSNRKRLRRLIDETEL